MSTALLIVGIILFIGLVVIHEFGHFIAGRRGGVEVEEFGIFFPPRLFKHRTKGGWIFSVNLLPLGGFVKLKGEHDSDTEKGSFGAASLWTKTKIMAAGVVMNLVTALILLTILAAIGIPKLIDNQYTVKSDTQVTSQKVLVSYVEPHSPAAKAGLKANDELTDIALPGYSPVAVTSSKMLPQLTQQFAGKTVDIYYLRGGHEEKGRTTLLSSKVVNDSRAAAAKAAASTKLDCANVPVAKGYLGIEPTDFVLQRSTWSAPVTAVGLSAQITGLTFEGLGKAVAGLGRTIAGLTTGNHVARENGQCAASSQVAGPVGIFVILQNGSSLGYQFMLFIIAIISLTLAIMNILPIPALDGGRLWIMLISRVLKRPLSAEKEELVNAIGFFVLIALVILITFVDVKRTF